MSGQQATDGARARGGVIARAGRALFSNAYLLLVLMAIFWAGNQVVGRAVAGHVPPLSLAASRWVIATALLLPFAWRQLAADWHLVRGHKAILAFLCGITGIHATVQYIALNHTTALNAMALNSITPILIALVSYLVFADRLSPRQILGVLISLAGVLVIVAAGDLKVLATLTFNPGDIIVLGNMALLAFYTAALRKRPPMHWLSFTALLYITAMVINVPLAAIEHMAGYRLQPTLLTWGSILFVAIFPSLFAYICYNRGVELIGAPRAGAFMHLCPLFGAAMAIVFLGEALMPYHVVGFLLIIVGVALAARKA